MRSCLLKIEMSTARHHAALHKYHHEINISMWRKNRSRRLQISVQKLPLERGVGSADSWIFQIFQDDVTVILRLGFSLVRTKKQSTRSFLQGTGSN